MVLNNKENAFCAFSYCTGFISFFLISVIPYLYLPLGSDIGNRLYFSSLVLQGILPYKELKTIVPMGNLWFYMLPIKLFGYSMLGFRVFDILFLLLCLAGIYKVGSMLFKDKSVGFWASLLFTLLYFYHPDSWYYTGEKDFYLAVFIIWSFYFWLKADFTPRKALCYTICGVLLGIAFWFKTTALVIIPAFVLMAFINKASLKFSGTNLSKVFYLGLGGLIPTGIVFFYLFSLDATAEMLEQVFLLPFSFYPTFLKPGFLSILSLMAETFLQEPIVILETILVINGLGMIILNSIREKKQELIFLLIFTFFTVVYTVAHGKYFLYHWFPFFLAYTILGGYSLSSLQRHITSYLNRFLPLKQLISIFVPLFISLLLSLSLIINVVDFYRFKFMPLIRGIDTLEEFYGHFNFQGGYSPQNCYQASNYIKKNTPVDAPVSMYIWSIGDFLMNFLLQKERVLTQYYPIGHPHVLSKEDRKSLIGELTKNKPQYLVWSNSEWNTCINDFIDLKNFLTDYYIHDNDFGYLSIYKLKEVNS
jgi:hypothetical protein